MQQPIAPFSTSSLSFMQSLIPAETKKENSFRISQESLWRPDCSQLILLNIIDGKYLEFITISGIGKFEIDEKIKKIKYKKIGFNLENQNYAISHVKMTLVNNQIYLLSIINMKSEERIDRISLDERNQTVRLDSIYRNDSTPQFVKTCTDPIPDSNRNCFYLVCGINRGGSSQYDSDIVKFSFKSKKWKVIGSLNNDMSPAMYYQTSLLWKGKYIIVFGGYNTSCSTCCDLLAFNVKSKSWSTLYLDETNCGMRLNKTEFPMYPTCGAGMQLVRNKWASQFDSSIPRNFEEDTLMIYGGHNECFINKKRLDRISHRVYLYHLDETKWKSVKKNKYSKVPFNLTEYCTPENRKLLPDSKEDTVEEYQILPEMNNLTLYKINTNHLLAIGKKGESLLIYLNEKSIFTKLNMGILTQLSDISINF